MRPILPRPRFLGRATVAIAVTVGLLAAIVAGAEARTPAAGSPSQRAQRRAKAVRVDIHEFAFHPHKLVVSRGTKVVFANSDPIAHTATRAGSFRTGHIRPGHSVAVKFDHPGVFAYHCSIHHFMHGKIVVR